MRFLQSWKNCKKLSTSLISVGLSGTVIINLLIYVIPVWSSVTESEVTAIASLFFVILLIIGLITRFVICEQIRKRSIKERFRTI